jgi:hypothetical protein
VITYLLQKCNVPVRHIVARRVEIKVLLNRGLAGNSELSKKWRDNHALPLTLCSLGHVVRRQIPVSLFRCN